MAAGQLTRGAVDLAVAEYDRLSRKAFLAKYGFRGARDYFLVVNGQNYDSKAIVAAAHGFTPGGRALTAAEFSGGLAGAARTLTQLGYEVTTPGQNADWMWDEHVLALDLYMQNPRSPPGKKSEPIKELSALLNAMGRKAGVAMTPKFRNANGVYQKLMNFRRFDPAFQSEGKVGLTHGNKMEKAVWDAYADDLPGLAARAAAIRLAIEDDAVSLAGMDADPELEAEEGAVVLRLHYSRERNPKLARQKKDQALKATGRLECEVCEFDFASRYGPHGDGFIEAHHRKLVSALKKGEKTKLADLALVCANCHRMLHRGGNLLGVDELKTMLRPT